MDDDVFSMSWILADSFSHASTHAWCALASEVAYGEWASMASPVYLASEPIDEDWYVDVYGNDDDDFDDDDDDYEDSFEDDAVENPHVTEWFEDA